MFFRRIKIAASQRGFASRRNELRYLTAGAHWLFGFGWKVRVESTGGTFVASDISLETLASDPRTWDDLAFAILERHERALVWIDGRLAWVLGGGPWALWRSGREVRIDVVDTGTLVLDPALVDAALVANGARALEAVVVPPRAKGYVLVNGEVQRELGPGRHAVWRAPNVRTAIVPEGPQLIAKTIGETWTRDLATVHAEVVLTYRVTDPRRWAESWGSPLERLRLGVESAMRAVVGARTLARLLADPVSAALAVEAKVVDVPEARVLGVSIGKVTVHRRLPRRRFRGFGDRGREVAAALQPYYRERHEARRF